MAKITRGKTPPSKTLETGKSKSPDRPDQRAAFETSTRLGLVRQALRHS